MAIALQGLRTTIYKVADVAKAKAWYTQLLGFPPYFDEPFYVGYNVGGYELGLQPAEGGPGDGVVTYWGVDDVQEAYDALLAQGATSLEKPADVGSGIVVAAVKDLDGNTVGLIYNPHFKLP